MLAAGAPAATPRRCRQHTGTRQLQTIADHQPHDVAAFRAERHSDAELSHALVVEKLITPYTPAVASSSVAIANPPSRNRLNRRLTRVHETKWSSMSAWKIV